MRRNVKIFTIVVVAFFGGVLTHSKLDAKIDQKPVALSASILPSPVQLGKASWYSRLSPGINKRTANNEIFDDRKMTAAMWDVPFNQKIKVTNLNNGKSVIVRINDRGPHKRYFRKGRIIDLSKNAFSKISGLKKGLINVEIEFL